MGTGTVSRLTLLPDPRPGVTVLATERKGNRMPIKALNDRKKLSNDFNEANDAFIDEVLSALQNGRLPSIWRVPISRIPLR